MGGGGGGVARRKNHQTAAAARASRTSPRMIQSKLQLLEDFFSFSVSAAG